MISKKIKMAMIDKEISAQDLADDLGCARQSVYNAIARDNFTSAKLEEIAAVLGCDVVLRDRKTGKIY